MPRVNTPASRHSAVLVSALILILPVAVLALVYSSSPPLQPAPLVGPLVACWILLSLGGFFLLSRQGGGEGSRNSWDFETLSQVLNCSSDGILIANRDGVTEFVNQAFTEISGYSAEELTGGMPSIPTQGQQHPEFHNKLLAATESGKAWCGEIINRKKDGSAYPARLTIMPLADKAGNNTHYVASLQDMTSRREMGKQLAHLQRMEALGTLAAGLAHDFNNALQIINGNLYLAHKNIDNREIALKRIKVIEKTIGRSATHIRRLLDFARQKTAEAHPVDINTCINHACDMVSPMLPKEIRLRNKSSIEAFYVNWDEIQAQQVLINLIVNACHALEKSPEPTITVAARLTEPAGSLPQPHWGSADQIYLCVSVQDNGCGISTEIKEKIFDPFFTTKEQGKGTGLGLPMVCGAVKEAGGRVEVVSEPGQGSEFNIYLPLATEKKGAVLTLLTQAGNNGPSAPEPGPAATAARAR